MSEREPELISSTELAAIIYKLLRKESADYTEAQINNSASLREAINQRVMAEAKRVQPDVTNRQWARALSQLPS